MPDDVLVDIVREWIAKAENDLTAATHTLTLGKDAPLDTICFHVQQRLEKYLKALLVSRSIAFPKTHDLVGILKLVPDDCRPAMDAAVQVRLTRYATVLRYPGAPEVFLPEAKKAVAIARRIRRDVRRLLPRAALRRKKK